MKFLRSIVIAAVITIFGGFSSRLLRYGTVHCISELFNEHRRLDAVVTDSAVAVFNHRPNALGWRDIAPHRSCGRQLLRRGPQHR